jgi:hypothetical protein
MGFPSRSRFRISVEEIAVSGTSAWMIFSATQAP